MAIANGRQRSAVVKVRGIISKNWVEDRPATRQIRPKGESRSSLMKEMSLYSVKMQACLHRPFLLELQRAC